MIWNLNIRKPRKHKYFFLDSLQKSWNVLLQPNVLYFVVTKTLCPFCKKSLNSSILPHINLYHYTLRVLLSVRKGFMYVNDLFTFFHSKQSWSLVSMFGKPSSNASTYLCMSTVFFYNVSKTSKESSQAANGTGSH